MSIESVFIRSSIVSILFLLLLSVSTTNAAVPQSIDYQGYLTDSTGVAINGSIDITLAIYSVEQSGSPLWSETKSVTVNKGLFSVELGGAVNPFPIGLFDTPLWLGISVGSDPEMSSRKSFNSTAFALKADDALTLDGTPSSALDQSAHVSRTDNPHGVTAAQTGAASSSDLSTHASNSAAHHSKTSSFGELIDQASDPQIPSTITRDSELQGHSNTTSVHHRKTTTFTELTDQVGDSQIPALIARDSEIFPKVLDNDGAGSTLNADLLDGLDSSAFMNAVTDQWINTDGDSMSGIFHFLSGQVRLGYRTTDILPETPLTSQSKNTSPAAFFVSRSEAGDSTGLNVYVEPRTFEGITTVGANFTAKGGLVSGDGIGIRSYAYANGTSDAYGIISTATGGNTSGREWAFYGNGNSYLSGKLGIGTLDPQNKIAVVGGAVSIGSGVQDIMSDGYLAVAKGITIGHNRYTGSMLDIDAAGPYSHAAKLNISNHRSTGLAVTTAGDTLTTGINVAATGDTQLATITYASQFNAKAYGSSNAYGVYSRADQGTTTGKEYAFYGIGEGYFSGNLGVGTDTPFYKFQVEGNSSNGFVSSFINHDTGISSDGIVISLGPLTGAYPNVTNSFALFTSNGQVGLGHIAGNGVGGINYFTSSDARLKTHISDYHGGLDLLKDIKVRNYEFIAAPGHHRIGFLAQELMETFPIAVGGDPNGNPQAEPMSVDYGRITPVLVSAIQELNEQMEQEISAIKTDYDKQLKNLQKENTDLKKEIQRIKTALNL